MFTGACKTLSFEVNEKMVHLRLHWFKPLKPQTTAEATTDDITTTEGTETKDDANLANSETEPAKMIDGGALKPVDDPDPAVKDALPNDGGAAKESAKETSFLVPSDTLLAMANRQEPVDVAFSESDSDADMNEMVAAALEESDSTAASGQTKENKRSESVAATVTGESGADATKKKESLRLMEVPGILWKAIEMEEGSLLFVFVNDIFGTGVERTIKRSCPKMCSEYGLVELAGKDKESVIICCPVSVLKELKYEKVIGKMEKWEQELNMKVDEEGDVPSEVQNHSKEVNVVHL